MQSGGWDANCLCNLLFGQAPAASPHLGLFAIGIALSRVSLPRIKRWDRRSLSLYDSHPISDINKNGWLSKESFGKRWIRKDATDEGNVHTFSLTYL
jgi:hypothetical protein